VELPKLTFSSGVLDPALQGRVDSGLYAAGMATATNMHVLPQGGAWNRPGTKYIGDVTRLNLESTVYCIPFVYSVDQSYLLVFVNARMYVIKNGAFVQSGGADYYLSMPPPSGLSAAFLTGIRWAQIADELYIVNDTLPPKRITRVADDNWTYETVGYGEATPLDNGPTTGLYSTNYTSSTSTNTYNAELQINLVRDGYESRFGGATSVAERALTVPWEAGDDIVGIIWQSPGFDLSVTPVVGGWVLSPVKSGAGINAYYLQHGSAYMTNPSEPDAIFVYKKATTSTNSAMKEATALNTLTAGSADFGWIYDDFDSLGYDTVYMVFPSGTTPMTQTDWDYPVFSYNGQSWRVYAALGGQDAAGLIAETVIPIVELSGDFVPQYGSQPYVDDKPVGQDANNWPKAVCFQAQRAWYGGFPGSPNRVNASRIGNLDGFGYHTPLQDDNAIEATIASTQVNGIRHMVPWGNDVLVFTDGAIWRAYGVGGIISPTTLAFDRVCDAWIGEAAPIYVGERLLFADRVGRIMELAQGSNLAAAPIDRTLHAAHLFRGKTVRIMCYQNSPERTLWCAMSDGSINVCTIVPEFEVWAWSQHTVGGTAAQCVSLGCIKEGARDIVYLAKMQTVNGTVKTYIEQVQDRYIDDIDEAWFLDCAVVATGSVSSVSGLDHLEGETVAALADTTVLTGLTVASGAVTLTGGPYARVVVGRPYTATMETLAINAPDGSIFGVYKNVAAVRIRLRDSRAFVAGNDATVADEIALPEYGPLALDATTGLATGVWRQLCDRAWKRNGGLTFQQAKPLPMTIDAVIPEFETEAR